MKTSMNLYFNIKIATKTKFDAIKATGFNEFFTGIYDKHETMKFDEQMQYAEQIGLKCSMVHCSYNAPLVDSFWLDGQDGENVVNDYIRQIEQCGRYTKNFVVHLNASKNSIVSEIGIERIKRMLNACEKYDLNLCVENLYSSIEIPYIFARISHPLLKICYDSGHNHHFTPGFKLCENYGKYVTALHIHENDGSADQHKTLSIGSPVFNQLKDELRYVSNDVALASEARVPGEDLQVYLNQDINSLKKLNELLGR